MQQTKSKSFEAVWSGYHTIAGWVPWLWPGRKAENVFASPWTGVLKVRRRPF